MDKKHETIKEFHEIFCDIKESLEETRVIVKYLMFDLEATRREQNELRIALENRE